MNRISLCMIVKNEATWLPKSLTSAKPFVDEMIVVDTGSTDNTIAIAKDLGANVGFFPWRDHFADAYNHALAAATGKWILVLGADEILQDPANVLRSLAERDQADVQAYRLNIFNHHSHTDTAPDNAIMALRFFRNSADIRYHGRIHEDIFIPANGIAAALPELQIHHYGYTPEEMARKSKNQRNLQLLNMSIAEETNPLARRFQLFSLGRVKQRLGDLDGAMESYTKTLAQLPPNDPLIPEVLHQRLACLIEGNLLNEALPEAERILRLYPTYTEVAFLQADILTKLGKLAAAERTLLWALSHPHVRPWLSSYNPRIQAVCWFGLGLIYDLLGNQRLAASCLAKSTLAQPPFPAALPELIGLLGRLPPAELAGWFPAFIRSHPELSAVLAPEFCCPQAEKS